MQSDKWLLDNGIDPMTQIKVNGKLKFLFEILEDYDNQQVKSVDLAEVVGSLPSDEEIRNKAANYVKT